MSFNFSNALKDLKSIGNKLSSELNNELLPLAQRTQRMVQERLGNVDDISQLPDEYLLLAAKCNNLEKLYTNILKISSIYETETYDYPLNVQESLNDFSKNITSKVSDLSKATSTSEAQAVFTTNTNSAPKPPKTFYHALARATDPSILAADETSPLVRSLDAYSKNINKIANARLGQDQLIKQKFNQPLRTTLRTLINQSTKIQKKVEQKRIDYDLARYNLTNCKPEKEAQLRVVMENCEDEFAIAVEDAVSIMKNVLDNAKPIQELLELIRAQLAYHKLANELLGSLVTDIESLSSAAGPVNSSNQEFDI